MDEIARAHPDCAFPTLDQVEDCRRKGEWKLLDERGGIQIPKTPLFSDGDNTFLMTAHRFHRRRLYRTEERLLGLGPEHLMTGDEVWILAGTGRMNVPLILQPKKNGNYRLVGSTYVHG